MDEMTGFVIAAFALSASPGPNTLSLAAVGSSYGWKVGLRYLLGINAGMAIIIALAATGVTTALLHAPFVAPVLTVFAMVYFLWLAWRIATAPTSHVSGQTTTEPCWRDGLSICLLNPKAYAAMTAMVAGPSLAQFDPVLDALTKGVVLMTLVVVVTNIWLLTGAALRKWLAHPKLRRRLNIGFAFLLLLSVGLSAMSAIY